MIKLIASSATVRVCCDAPAHDFTAEPAPDFTGHSANDCLRQAREAGFKFTNKGKRCFCPIHQTVQKPPASLLEQALAVLEAVTNPSGADPARPITDPSLQPECVFCHQFMWGTRKHTDNCEWLKARMFLQESRERKQGASNVINSSEHIQKN